VCGFSQIEPRGARLSRQGYGVTKSNICCLEKARRTNLEMIIVLEDDARLFDRSTIDFCQADNRNTVS
jgi:GR25 family glycosyltransferase involved in LPS biosynthesis